LLGFAKLINNKKKMDDEKDLEMGEIENKQVPITVKEMYDTQYNSFIQRQHVLVSILEKLYSMEKRMIILEDLMK
jgi:hypothetical protein